VVKLAFFVDEAKQNRGGIRSINYVFLIVLYNEMFVKIQVTIAPIYALKKSAIGCLPNILNNVS